MICPRCQSNQTGVIDSRESASFVRRRRECSKCSNRFTTYEVSSESLEKAEALLARLCDLLPVLEDTLDVVRDMGDIPRYTFKPAISGAAHKVMGIKPKRKKAA